MTRISKQKKYFTIAEANSALVLVKPIVKDVLNCINKISYLKEILDTNSQNNELSEMQNLQFRLIHHLNELNSIGVVLTDLNAGTVDFPMLKNQEEAYFCWKYGEEEICFYHDENCNSKKRTYLYNLAQNKKAD